MVRGKWWKKAKQMNKNNKKQQKNKTKTNNNNNNKDRKITDNLYILCVCVCVFSVLEITAFCVLIQSQEENTRKSALFGGMTFDVG